MKWSTTSTTRLNNISTISAIHVQLVSVSSNCMLRSLAKLISTALCRGGTRGFRPLAFRLVPIMMHDLKDRREYANAGERCTGRQRPQPEAIDNLMHDRRNLRTLGDCLLFVCHLGHSRSDRTNARSTPPIWTCIVSYFRTKTVTSA